MNEKNELAGSFFQYLRKIQFFDVLGTCKRSRLWYNNHRKQLKSVVVKKSRHGTELFFCIFSVLHEFGFFGQDAL